MDYVGLNPDKWRDRMLPLLVHKRIRLTQPQNKSGNFSEIIVEKPIPFAEPPKASVCGRLLDGIAVSNPAGGIDVCLR